MATELQMEERLRNLSDLRGELCGCSVAIGNFDGVHLGHQKILMAARALTGPKGRPVVAMTFDPPPERVISPRTPPLRVVPHKRKCELLLAAGADVVVTAAATPELLSMPPGAFIEEIIVRRLGPSHVVEGQDFRFGAGRRGDVELLKDVGPRCGFELHVVDPTTIALPSGDERISSTLIRRLVAGGQVELAALCMGRPYVLYGDVIRGEGIGRGLGFPTANVSTGEQVPPGEGVYAGAAVVDGRRFAAAISVGHKLTTGATKDLFIEAFLLDASENLYGRPMELAFLRRLRDQQKFPDFESLGRQIERDVEQVRRLVGTGGN